VLHVKLDGRNKIDKAVQFHLNHISKIDLVLLGHMHSYGEIEMECEISSPHFQASEYTCAIEGVRRLAHDFIITCIFVPGVKLEVLWIIGTRPE
jgi:hypothetical protein